MSGALRIGQQRELVEQPRVCRRPRPARRGVSHSERLLERARVDQLLLRGEGIRIRMAARVAAAAADCRRYAPAALRGCARRYLSPSSGSGARLGDQLRAARHQRGQLDLLGRAQQREPATARGRATRCRWRATAAPTEKQSEQRRRHPGEQRRARETRRSPPVTQLSSMCALVEMPGIAPGRCRRRRGAADSSRSRVP